MASIRTYFHIFRLIMASQHKGPMGPKNLPIWVAFGPVFGRMVPEALRAGPGGGALPKGAWPKKKMNSYFLGGAFGTVLGQYGLEAPYNRSQKRMPTQRMHNQKLLKAICRGSLWLRLARASVHDAFFACILWITVLGGHRPRNL